MNLYKYMDKQKKKDRYSELMSKLKISIQEEFYYETIFIVFAILEDRTESLLKHANVNILKEDNQKLSLSEKLEKIKHHDIFHSEYVQKHLTKELIQKIYDWKVVYELSHGFIDKSIRSRIDIVIDQKNKNSDTDYYRNIHELYIRMEKETSKRLRIKGGKKVWWHYPK